MSNSYLTLEESLSFVNGKYNASILGYVIMPNHIHLIVFFEEDNHLSAYMRDFKKYTSTRIRQRLGLIAGEVALDEIRVNQPGRAFQVWEDRFDDVYLEDKKLLEVKLDYIHSNPLQAHWNLVTYPEDYPYSSSKFYETGVQNGLNVRDYREFFE